MVTQALKQVLDESEWEHVCRISQCGGNRNRNTKDRQKYCPKWVRIGFQTLVSALCNNQVIADGSSEPCVFYHLLVETVLGLVEGCRSRWNTASQGDWGATLLIPHLKK